MEDYLKNALKLLSNKYQIDPLTLRIKISKPKKDLEYHIMQNGEDIEQTNVATALNLNAAVAFAVGVKLNSIFNKLSREKSIDSSKMNIRIYTKSEDFYPQIYLFDDVNPKCKVALEEI